MSTETRIAQVQSDAWIVMNVDVDYCVYQYHQANIHHISLYIIKQFQESQIDSILNI